MRILVLGGTVFLSREVAASAVRRGHDVDCACRGVSGSVPEGARLVRWDRAQPVPHELAAASYDAVVDVARIPSQVRAAVAAWPAAHWVFVSSISAYADPADPGGPGTGRLLEPIHDDLDPNSSPEAYGAMKVACEQLVQAGTATSAVVRPGLIVGPGDPTGRFSYWARRLGDHAEVLAPGHPEDLVQIIDVRDLADWLVLLAEQRTEGVFDGVGPVTALRDLLRACEPDARLAWVDQDALVEAGVAAWAGPNALPLWLPRPEYDGMLAHDAKPALEAGLEIRPARRTYLDTRAWLTDEPTAPVTGIDREREAELLRTLRR